MFWLQIDFFGGLNPLKDMKNEGIEIYSISPCNKRFKVNDQFIYKHTLIDMFHKDTLENGYRFKMSSSNRKRWDIKFMHKLCK